jgi:hypothetical protein
MEIEDLLLWDLRFTQRSMLKTSLSVYDAMQSDIQALTFRISASIFRKLSSSQHWTLSWENRIQCTSRPIHLRTTKKVSNYLRLGLTFGFPTNKLYAFLTSLLRATFPTRHPSPFAHPDETDKRVQFMRPVSMLCYFTNVSALQSRLFRSLCDPHIANHTCRTIHAKIWYDMTDTHETGHVRTDMKAPGSFITSNTRQDES